MLLLLFHLSNLVLLLRTCAAFATHSVSFRVLTLERLVADSGSRGRLLVLYPQHLLLLGHLFFFIGTDFDRLLLLIHASVLRWLFLDDPICRPRDLIVDISPLLLLLR